MYWPLYWPNIHKGDSGASRKVRFRSSPRGYPSLAGGLVVWEPGGGVARWRVHRRPRGPLGQGGERRHDCACGTLNKTGVWGSLLPAMNDRDNPTMDSEPKDARPVSFADAARFLGVDLFVFYSLVQREEISTVLTAWGEFAITQETLNRLAAAKE